MVAWGGFHWIIYVAQYFAGFPLPLAIALLCLFCLVAAPQMVAFYLVGHSCRFRIERLPLFLRPLFWAALYTGLEFLARFLKIFPEHLGNTLVQSLSLAQAASLGGVSLLSFLPLFAGASIAYVRKEGIRAWPSLACAAVLTIALWNWGAAEKKRVDAEPTEILRVGLVQQNLEEVEKLALRMNSREAINLTISTMAMHTNQLGLESPDLIVWPETAYPLAFPTGGDFKFSSAAYGYANLVKSAVRQAKAPLLFGGYENLQLGADSVDYNSAILLGRDGEPLASYRKQVLLLFGEYIPLSETFTSLKTLNPDVGNFGRGPGAVLTQLPWGNKSVPLGINICYEAILPEYMRTYAREGARLFVNLTKDSWFGDTFEPWEHFQLSLMRSIEHHIPMVRSTNTGLSGLVTATGETKLLSPPFHEAVQIIEVPLSLAHKPTPYTRFGEWFAFLCLGLSLGIALFAFRKKT